MNTFGWKFFNLSRYFEFVFISVILVSSNRIHLVVSNVCLVWPRSHLRAASCSGMHGWGLSIRSLDISSDTTISRILNISTLVFISIVKTRLEIDIFSIIQTRWELFWIQKFTTRIKHRTHFSDIICYTKVGLGNLGLELFVLFLNPSHFCLHLADLLVKKWIWL